MWAQGLGQTGRQLMWATSNEKVESARGRRAQGMYQEGRHTRLAGGRARHKKATAVRPRPCAGDDNGHPRVTKVSGFAAIRSFPASFLDSPPVQEPAAMSPSLGSSTSTCQASHPRAHESPGYIPQCRYFLHHLCPSVMSPWLRLEPFQVRDPGAAAYTNLVNATQFCPGYQSKMSLQCSTFIKVLMELESSHKKARWLVFLCY